MGKLPSCSPPSHLFLNRKYSTVFLLAEAGAVAQQLLWILVMPFGVEGDLRPLEAMPKNKVKVLQYKPN